jgi:hypothetical protein
VPPPPVGGAAAGNGLAAGLGFAAGLAAALADEGLADEGRALALAVLSLAVPLGRTVGVAEALLPGENVVGVAEGEDPEQAEIDTEASMAEVAQLAAINLARRPAPLTRVVRIFMSLLTRPAGDGSVSRSRIGREIVGARPLPAPTERRSPEAPRVIKVIPLGQYRHVMDCSPLEYQATRVEPSGED